MGYLVANLYPLLLVGLICGMAIGWFACDGASNRDKS